MPDLYSCEQAWYCLKALPKKEHLAATLLQKQFEIETFAPRIRYTKKTQRGKVDFVEALFPGYLFVHTALKDTYRAAMSVNGVRGVVAYGNRVPVIPARFISEIRARLPAQAGAPAQDQEPPLRVGQEVTVIDGPFRNWQGIVSGTVSAHGRIKVLLEFLGQQLNVDLPADSLAAELGSPRERIFKP